MNEYDEKIIAQSDYLRQAFQTLQEGILKKHPEWASLSDGVQQEIFQPAWNAVVCDFVSSVNEDAAIQAQAKWEGDVGNVEIKIPVTMDMLKTFDDTRRLHDWIGMISSIVQNRCSDAVTSLMDNGPGEAEEAAMEAPFVAPTVSPLDPVGKTTMHKVVSYFPGGMTGLAKDMGMNNKTLLRHLRAETEDPNLDFISTVAEMFDSAFPEGSEKLRLLVLVNKWDPTKAESWLSRWQEERASA